MQLLRTCVASPRSAVSGIHADQLCTDCVLTSTPGLGRTMCKTSDTGSTSNPGRWQGAQVRALQSVSLADIAPTDVPAVSTPDHRGTMLLLVPGQCSSAQAAQVGRQESIRGCRAWCPSSCRSGWPRPCWTVVSGRSGWTPMKSTISLWPTPVRPSLGTQPAGSSGAAGSPASGCKLSCPHTSAQPRAAWQRSLQS